MLLQLVLRRVEIYLHTTLHVKCAVFIYSATCKMRRVPIATHRPLTEHFVCMFRTSTSYQTH
jgi:hypothetical protein